MPTIVGIFIAEALAILSVLIVAITGVLLRQLLVGLMMCALCGCGSIVSRTVPGQGHGNQYYPGVQWDLRDSRWRYLTVLDLPFSLILDTLLLPVDVQHGAWD